jgi:hypothetical protein
MNSEAINVIDHLYIWRRAPRTIEFYWVSGGTYSLIQRMPLMKFGLPRLVRDMAQLDEHFALSQPIMAAREVMKLLYDFVARRQNELWLRIDAGDRLLAAIPWEEFLWRETQQIKRWPFFSLSPWRREEMGGNFLLLLGDGNGQSDDLSLAVSVLLKDVVSRRARLLIASGDQRPNYIPVELTKMMDAQVSPNLVTFVDPWTDALTSSYEASADKKVFEPLKSRLLRNVRRQITVAVDTVWIAGTAMIRGDKGGLLVSDARGRAEFLACGELVEFLASIGACQLSILVKAGSAVAARHLAHEITSTVPVEVEVADARANRIHLAALSRQNDLPTPFTPAVRYESPLSAALEEGSPLRQASQEFLLNHTVAKSLGRSIESSETLRWLQAAQRFLERGAARAFEDLLRFPEASDEGREAWNGVISGLRSLSEALAPPEREVSTRTVRTAV